MKLGPYELNQIYCGECSQMLAALPDGCIDLTVTSPPYDSLRLYNGYTFDFEPIARQLYRITKPGGVVVWVVGDETKDFNETGNSFRQALMFQELGFCLETMFYEKESITWNETSRRYKQTIDFVFVLSKGKPKTFNPIRDVKIKHKRSRIVGSARQRNFHYELYINKNEKTVRGNVWRYHTGTNGDDKTGHPAIFPEALARDHILSWSNPGDIVLDPMVGSGTTAKMAIETGRRFLGFDISQEYVDLARRRISGAKIPLFIEMESSQIEANQLSLLQGESDD